MKDVISSELSRANSGGHWFDPLEEAVRFHVRGFIEGIVEEKLTAALGGRGRSQRNAYIDHRSNKPWHGRPIVKSP